MIQFSRDGTKVKATVTVEVPNYDTRLFSFMWECNGEAYAGLLSKRMDARMRDHLEDIRRDAYNDGWKDAKSKRVKQTGFGNWW